MAEALEGRILLYSTIGQWTYSSRITYSFMPDGTSIGGVPSALFQTLNAVAPAATWQNQIQQAATPWEANANLNLAQVADNGEPVGAPGNQQDDPNVGDVRIGAAPLGPGVLAETFLPPPTNGGTLAGDIILNSQASWAVGTTYDLQTVVAHEFGHALGLGESAVPNAVMYGTYDGIKTALVSDDIAGIQSRYGAPQYDQFNSGGHRNGTALTATNITPYIDANGQIAIPGLDNTTAGQSEWYAVTVPAANSGTMAVTVQSVKLSSLAPAMYIFNSSLQQVTMATTPTTYGSELSVSVPVSAGQKYYIKVLAGGSYGQVGAYGLELNFGSKSQPMISPPNTVVPAQPNQGGGSINGAVTPTNGNGSNPGGGIGMGTPGVSWAAIGELAGWVATYSVPAADPVPGPAGPLTGPVAPDVPPIAVTPAPVSTPAPAVVGANPTGPWQAGTGTASNTSATPTRHRHKHVPHAVDTVLSGWAIHRRRPGTTARTRQAGHGPASTS